MCWFCHDQSVENDKAAVVLLEQVTQCSCVHYQFYNNINNNICMAASEMQSDLQNRIKMFVQKQNRE